MPVEILTEHFATWKGRFVGGDQCSPRADSRVRWASTSRVEQRTGRTKSSIASEEDPMRLVGAAMASYGWR
jgi:hypothetical protein